MSTLPRTTGTTPPVPTGERPGLRRHALGFPTVLAQSIALISPTMTAVLIIPLAFADAGQGTWMAYAFGTIMLLFVVLCLNQFAKRSALAGSMYGFTARGLGPTAGVLSGWTLIWSYLFIGIAGLTGFSIFAAQLLSALGFSGTIPPACFFVLSGSVCWFIAYKDIRVSSILTLLFECLSVTCILALAAVVLFKHGFHLDTTQLKVKGMGLHGLSLAVVVCIFSLVGFESATALGSEARKPLTNIPRAVVASLLITGAFMVVMSYVEVLGFEHAGLSLASASAPLTELSKAYSVAFFRIPIALGAMVSFFSLTLSCLNAGARIMYPMAQHMVVPHQLGMTHPHNKTPHVAITTYVSMMVGVALVLEIFTDPLTIFGDAGTLAAFGFLTAYFLISIAAPFYLRKAGVLRPRHTALAVIACLFLLVPTIGSFYPVPPFPVNVFPYIFLTYMLLGSAWLYVAGRRRRGLFREIESDLEDTMAAWHDSGDGATAPIDVTTPARPAPLTPAVSLSVGNPPGDRLMG